MQLNLSYTNNSSESPNIISSAIDIIPYSYTYHIEIPASTPSPIIFNETIIPYSPEDRNLVVIFDSTLSF